jgi:uncharacterized membrane protein
MSRPLRQTGPGRVEAAEHEARIEARLEATAAVAVVMALQILLAAVSRAESWTLWSLPWWVWLICVGPELALVSPLALEAPARALAGRGYGRRVTIALIALVSVANAFLLLAVIASLVEGREKSGAQLLLKGLTVWGTNVIAFGLWYWELDRGGPIRRIQPDPPPRDFQFPQDENPQLAEPGWHPRLVDYVYVSFTNSIAFSPTDAMPLTRWAKLLMLFESAISAVTILLVAARAVNIFT